MSADETAADPTANGTAGAAGSVAASVATEPVAEAAEAAAPGPAKNPGRREMSAALVLLLVGAAVVLSLAGRVWARGKAPAHGSLFAIEATGSAVSKAPTALGLVALAGFVAVLATRGVWRVLVGLVLAAAGAGVAAIAVAGASDTSAVNAAAASKAAVEGVKAIDVTHTAWPWATFLGGLLILLAGVVVMVRGRRWPGMSSRYEAPGATPGTARAAAKRPRTSADLWNALDRGEDPTGEDARR